VTNLHQILQAIVTVLAVINPVVCGSLFLTLTPTLTAPQRRREAAKVAVNILVVLTGSALVGLKVLSIFGISLDVFKVVGGMIIAYMGFDMLRGSHTVAQGPPENGNATVQGSLAPLLMFAAGPGTITAVVTLAAVHTPWVADDGDHRRRCWHRRYVCRVDTGCPAWASFRPRHASDDHTLHGTHRGVDGNAVCVSQPKGIV